MTGGTVSPVNEGERVELTCQTTGGRPTPKVTWWQRGRELVDNADSRTLKRTDAVTAIRTSSDFTTAASTIILTATRDLHANPLVCHARAQHPDHAISRPRTTAVTLDILRKYK